MDPFVRRAGPGADEPAVGTVVFLHGFPLDGSIWDAQLAALPDGWRALAPDLRGFGRTELRATPGAVPSGNKIGGRIARATEPVLTMRVLAADVAKLIRDEVDGPAVVCGLSMGGYVAFELWRRDPDLVRALVLVDTRAEPDSDEARENRMRMAQTARATGVVPIAAAMLPGLLSRDTLDHRPDVVDSVRRMILDTPAATIIGALAGMAARNDSTKDLGAISVPALVVVGSEDAITPADAARSMADAIPDARLEIIDGAAHLPVVEQPESFNRALADFLGQLS